MTNRWLKQAEAGIPPPHGAWGPAKPPLAGHQGQDLTYNGDVSHSLYDSVRGPAVRREANGNIAAIN